MSSGSEFRAAFIVATGWALVAIAPASAQTPPCAGGVEPVGWLGISGIECNCTVREEGSTATYSFRSEPRVLSVTTGSPAAGVVRPGDEIVAVGGEPITTARGGRLYGNPAPGGITRLTVRRQGRLMEVTLRSAAVCPSDPRAEPSTPQAYSQGRENALRLPRRAQARAPEAIGGLARGWQDRAWFGFGIECARCSLERNAGRLPRWSFEENPRLTMVEAGSPADRAGLREGDELVRIDGVGLRTDEGGRRFGAVRPGEIVRWTYLRGGREDEVAMEVTERPPEILRPLRFRDLIGNVEVEVFGSPGVVTTIVEPGRDLIIDTGDARIRVRVRR